MTKSNYLERLKQLLDQYNMNESLKEDIIKDYDTLWQEYQELNMIDIDIVEKLGQPEVIDVSNDITKDTNDHHGIANYLVKHFDLNL